MTSPVFVVYFATNANVVIFPMTAKVVEVMRRCTRLSSRGVKDSGRHVSGTDPLPLLTKKRRIDELDFNFAYQLDNYLKDNDTHVDNFFDANVD